VFIGVGVSLYWSVLCVSGVQVCLSALCHRFSPMNWQTLLEKSISTKFQKRRCETYEVLKEAVCDDAITPIFEWYSGFENSQTSAEDFER
jgi:hypothetical protein